MRAFPDRRPETFFFFFLRLAWRHNMSVSAEQLIAELINTKNWSLVLSQRRRRAREHPELGPVERQRTLDLLDEAEKGVRAGLESGSLVVIDSRLVYSKQFAGSGRPTRATTTVTSTPVSTSAEQQLKQCQYSRACPGSITDTQYSQVHVARHHRRYGRPKQVDRLAPKDACHVKAPPPQAPFVDSYVCSPRPRSANVTDRPTWGEQALSKRPHVDNESDLSTCQ